MRKIKFKVFCKRHNREEIYTLGDLIVCNAGSENGEGGIFKNWRQYTGLKDKNGKEIYDGDIIHIHHKFFEEFNYVLKWNEEELRYYLYSIDKKNLNSIGGILEVHLGSMINEIEVIGNIYDNPDLLEKGAEE